MWDRCPVCHWRNDDCLFIDEDLSVTVGFDIPHEAWSYYSFSNRKTPDVHRSRLSRPM
jgi:hypothetical protein